MGVFGDIDGAFDSLIDSILYELQTLPMHTRAYAHDFTMLVIGRDHRRVCKNIQCIIDFIYNWCPWRGLRINSNKTGMVFLEKGKTGCTLLSKDEGNNSLVL